MPAQSLLSFLKSISALGIPNNIYRANDIYEFIPCNENHLTFIWISLNIAFHDQLEGSGLAPIKWQANTWTYSDQVHWHIYAFINMD